MKNIVTRTEPAILHGNGLSKITLNYLGNYVPNTWNYEDGCIKCKNGQLDLRIRQPNELPLVCMSIFVELNTPFLEEGLQKLYSLEYPKEKIHLFIHNNVGISVE